MSKALNVGISTEFARLIDAQRDFEANPKTLTTSNQLRRYPWNDQVEPSMRYRCAYEFV
jgi:flagellar basal body rod protein FlgG